MLFVRKGEPKLSSHLRSSRIILYVMYMIPPIHNIPTNAGIIAATSKYNNTANTMKLKIVSIAYSFFLTLPLSSSTLDFALVQIVSLSSGLLAIIVAAPIMTGPNMPVIQSLISRLVSICL